MVETGGLRLRRAVKEEVERLWEIGRGQTAEEFCLWGADLVYEYPPRLEQMRRRFEAVSGDVVLFAAECGGRPSGLRRSGKWTRREGAACWRGCCWRRDKGGRAEVRSW